MSGICDTCRKDPCSQSADGLKFCAFHEGSESNYERLFGTPERATRTLFRFTPTCRDCALRDECEGMDDCLLSDYDALLEWLSGDAE